MKKTALVDYGMGNLRSVARALEKAGGNVKIVSKPQEIDREIEAVVFPGQGAISDTKKALAETNFDIFLKNWIAENKPFMGICLGLQILFEHSEEGDVDGLGVFRGNVRRFPAGTSFKVPHTGWNSIKIVSENAGNLMKNIHKDNEFFYFVHSYYVDTPQKEIIWSTTNYAGTDFVSGIRCGNIFAVQFHPEKSQSKGIQLYKNFLNSF